MLAHPARGKRRWCVFCSDSFTRKADVLCCAGRMEEMTAALKTACAWAFVSSLPNGVNTKIAEHGGGLSEGQAQRIAIARAVLRGAPILLLDEATSALDEKTEAQVLKNLLTALPDTACILTTHRPGALKYCTRLYKAENGALTCIEVNKPA